MTTATDLKYVSGGALQRANNTEPICGSSTLPSAFWANLWHWLAVQPLWSIHEVASSATYVALCATMHLVQSRVHSFCCTMCNVAMPHIHRVASATFVASRATLYCTVRNRRGPLCDIFTGTAWSATYAQIGCNHKTRCKCTLFVTMQWFISRSVFVLLFFPVHVMFVCVYVFICLCQYPLLGVSSWVRMVKNTFLSFQIILK